MRIEHGHQLKLHSYGGRFITHVRYAPGHVEYPSLLRKTETVKHAEVLSNALVSALV